MHRLIYISDAVRPMTDADFEAILGPARSINADLEVTGLLVYAQQTFLQAVEGERDAVEQVYARAAASSRHRNLRRCTAEVVSSRYFPDWSMGFEHAAPSSVVQTLLAPLVAEGHLSHREAAGILLARFSLLGTDPGPVEGAVSTR